jgi:hypothetical protein
VIAELSHVQRYQSVMIRFDGRIWSMRVTAALYCVMTLLYVSTKPFVAANNASGRSAIVIPHHVRSQPRGFYPNSTATTAFLHFISIRRERKLSLDLV